MFAALENMDENVNINRDLGKYWREYQNSRQRKSSKINHLRLQFSVM
jgi:hypothetical protein